MRELNVKTKGVTLALIASIGYGTMPAATQRAFQAGLSIETVLSSRFFIATIILWSYVLIKKLPYRLTLRHMISLILLGVLGFVTAILLNESYKFLPGAVASLLFALYVVLVVIIEIAIGRERPTLQKWMCVLAASIGVCAIIWSPEESTAINSIGILLACLAGGTYAIFVIGIGGKRTKATMSEIVTAYTMLPSTAFNIIRCLISGQPVFPVNESQWVCIVYLSLISTFLASVCFCKAIKYIGSSNAALVNTIEPFIAYFVGIVLMSDTISLQASLGGILIVLAVFWLNFAKRSISSI